ncbi:unnamed protein product [Peniophora sp. CBMAI 1063]|nr:unnamed protein product [Peniophora sp. CBMAI 1063]
MPNFPTLSSVIESVCDLIQDLPASVAKNPPKTRTIPTTTIEKLRTLGRELSRTLAETDTTPLLAPAPSELSAIKAQLDELTRKVDNITTPPIPIRTSGQEPPRPATASTSPRDDHVTPPPAQRRDASLDIVVTPKVASPPTLLEEAPKSILKRLNDRIRRHRTLKDLCQLEDGFTAPVFRAVMPQADGSLRLLVCTQAQRCVLVAQTDSWLKQCLPTHQFSYGPRPRATNHSKLYVQPNPTRPSSFMSHPPTSPNNSSLLVSQLMGLFFAPNISFYAHPSASIASVLAILLPTATTHQPVVSVQGPIVLLKGVHAPTTPNPAQTSTSARTSASSVPPQVVEDSTTQWTPDVQ